MRYIIVITASSVIEAETEEEAREKAEQGCDALHVGWDVPYPNYEIEVEEYD